LIIFNQLSPDRSEQHGAKSRIENIANESKSRREFSSNPIFHTSKRRRQVFRLCTSRLRHVRSSATFATDLLRDEIDQFSGFDFIVLTIPSREH
jgi:hypothetical protein